MRLVELKNITFCQIEMKRSCLVVAPHSVAESLVCHDLSLPVEKSQEAFLHRLQLLLVHLREEKEMMEE